MSFWSKKLPGVTKKVTSVRPGGKTVTTVKKKRAPVAVVPATTIKGVAKQIKNRKKSRQQMIKDMFNE